MVSNEPRGTPAATAAATAAITDAVRLLLYEVARTGAAVSRDADSTRRKTTGNIDVAAVVCKADCIVGFARSRQF